ncbi:MAG TPA: glycosyltransferase family A protein [Thermoanaerobaculia bacterium]|nr:glycosyltransferase family A protein [Thermoanaerobaculia bacterium]
MASAAFGGVCVLLFLVNAATMDGLDPSVAAGAGGPLVSAIVPARDEARGIEAAVRSHLAQSYPNLEVIVVDDRSTDATGTILANLAREDARLTVVSGVEPPEGWLGKPHALHQGAARARGDLLLFADADVRFAPAAVAEAVGLLEARKLDLLALFPRLELEGFWENVLMAYLPVAYFFGPAFLLNSDAQRRFAAGAGAGMLVRAASYRAAGGHEALRASMIDDLHLATRVRRAGGRCRMVRADERLRLRMYRGFREVFDGFTKNMAYVFEGWAGVFLAAMTVFSFVAWSLPACVLLAAALGAGVPGRDVAWAAAGLGLTLVGRAAISLFLRYPLWPALTHPFMALVWMAITARSLSWRFLHREVRWRGRRYPAAIARF